MKKAKQLKKAVKKTTSGIHFFNGPSPEEQITSVIENKSWTLLNLHLLRDSSIKEDDRLCIEANVIKHTLQTYGPNNSNKIPSLLENKGKAQGVIFHGHINNSNGKMYVLEWEILDPENKIMAFTRFSKHENYQFKQAPMKDGEKLNLLSKTSNVRTMQAAESQKIKLIEKYGAEPKVNLANTFR